MNSYALSDKTVFITGALGQIGRAVALHLLSHGAFVYIGDKEKKISNDLEKNLRRATFKNFQYISIDVTNEKSIQTAHKKLARPIDILINCAGIGVYTPFEARSTEDLDKVYAVNLKGAILCSKVFSADMIKRKSGRIINFGSIYGIATPDFKIYGNSGRNSSEIYGATKAGVIHVTKYLAAYLAKHNILANSISPGGVFNHQDPNFVRKYKAKTPLGRMAEPEDLTGLIAFLCSDDARYITGQNIAVDGGFTL